MVRNRQCSEGSDSWERCQKYTYSPVPRRCWRCLPEYLVECDHRGAKPVGTAPRTQRQLRLRLHTKSSEARNDSHTGTSLAVSERAVERPKSAIDSSITEKLLSTQSLRIAGPRENLL